jgi:hypothetical protein
MVKQKDEQATKKKKDKEKLATALRQNLLRRKKVKKNINREEK